MANAFDMLDLLEGAGVDPSKVAKVSSCTAEGTWTISGLKIGKPLYILLTAETDYESYSHTRIRAVSGTDDAIRGDYISEKSFLLGCGNGEGSTNCLVVIPTATTVVFDVSDITNYTTMNAYQ